MTFTFSKGIFQGELQNARVACALNNAKRRRTQIGNRSVEVDVVQHVEEFKTKLESLAFADLEKPRQIAVHAEESRSLERIVARVAIRARRVGNKCRGVYPNERIRIADVRTADNIGPTLPHACEGRIHARHRIEQEPRVSRGQE